MNKITMQSKLFHSYFDDKQFLHNAEMQSREYLKKYRETGECAFFDFVVVTDDNSSAPICLLACRNKSSGKYCISVVAPFYKRSQDDNLRYSELMCSYKYLKDGAIDIYIDLPKENTNGINDDIIEDFGNDILKFPPELIRKISAKTLPMICIFAKVQMSALKTSRKIRKATKQAQNKSIEFRPSDNQKPNVIYLNEKMTLTIKAGSESDSKREFIRHCEAWMVRGHYRHYKSGKVVYINPYKKGHGEINDKIYKTK